MSLENNDIRFLLVVGVAAMLMLFISVLIAFIFSQRKKLQYQRSLHVLQQAQQYHLVDAAVRSEETERLRIADELHDEVGALLSSSKLHFKMIQLKKDSGQNQALYEKGNTLLDTAITKVRGISHALHSYILKEFGLNDAIVHFVEEIVDESVIKISTAMDGNYKTTVPQNDLAVYRIVQELLNNIIKYAAPKTLHIGSVYKNGNLLITMVHNGQGLTQPMFEELRYKGVGLGLKNIQNRIYLLQGEITFYQNEGDYRIELNIPKPAK